MRIWIKFLLFGTIFFGGLQMIKANQVIDAGGRWMIVNDGVMGGRSESHIRRLDTNSYRFYGQLSLENNGGFASVRYLLDRALSSEVRYFCFKARGDGREYQLRARTQQNFDAVAYVAKFKSQNEKWQTYKIALAEFVPQWRGRVVTGVPGLNASDIRQVGFLLADKNPGDFLLEFHSLMAC